MLQTKEPDKVPEDELSKVKISNLPNKEFKDNDHKDVCSTSLGGEKNVHSEKFHKNLENMNKKIQTELKSTMSEKLH